MTDSLRALIAALFVACVSTPPNRPVSTLNRLKRLEGFPGIVAQSAVAVVYRRAALTSTIVAATATVA
jgi:hypothetical protein